MKRGIILLLCISVGVVSFFVYSSVSERMERITEYSPDNKYAVTALWIDVGGFGYRGRIYFVNEVGKKFYTGYDVPASYEWVSDNEFYVDKGSGAVYYFKTEDFK